MSMIGNQPGQASQRVTTTFNVGSTTATFTPTSGYTLGYLDVYLNGVKLVNGDDYTASNGTTFTLTTSAVAGDVVEAVAYIPRGLSDGYTKAEHDASLTPTNVSDKSNASTGYFDLPAGTTAQRPASPGTGMTRFNTDLGLPEWYDAASSSWKLFTQSKGYSVEYLVVAGGGAGGEGGGGAGGYVANSGYVITGTSYSATVGGGGGGGGFGASVSNGSNSSLQLDGETITAFGGGRGGNMNQGDGASGGSGGGGRRDGGNLGGPAKIGSKGAQGCGGGTSRSTTYTGAAGGGGGSSAGMFGSGLSQTAERGGAGGAGIEWFNGDNYCGGGGGGTEFGATAGNGKGGWGGGGAGNNGTISGASSGSANKGGGGGGVGSGSGNSGSGGSGIVIIRYAGSTRGSGGTVTSAGGYTYHTFTTSGTFTA